MSCLSFWVPRAVGPLHPPVIQMLGGNEFRLRRGFAYGKTLERRKGGAARKGRCTKFKMVNPKFEVSGLS